MLGRRSHARVTLTPAGEGVLHVRQPVVIRPGVYGQVVAISREAAVPHDVLMMELSGEGHQVEVEVMESRPIVLHGSLSHRLRLRPRTSGDL